MKTGKFSWTSYAYVYHPLHCLWAKWNNRMRGQFECDVTWFCSCFDFVRSHARCGCCSIVRLDFQVLQIKQVDCKIVRLQLNEKKSKESQTGLMELENES